MNFLVNELHKSPMPLHRARRADAVNQEIGHAVRRQPDVGEHALHVLLTRLGPSGFEHASDQHAKPPCFAAKVEGFNLERLRPVADVVQLLFDESCVAPFRIVACSFAHQFCQILDHQQGGGDVSRHYGISFIPRLPSFSNASLASIAKVLGKVVRFAVGLA